MLLHKKSQKRRHREKSATTQNIKKPQKAGATVKTIESHEGWDNKLQTECTKIQIHCYKPQKRGQPRKVQQISKNSKTAKSATNQRKFKKPRKVQQFKNREKCSKPTKTQITRPQKRRFSRKILYISENSRYCHIKPRKNRGCHESNENQWEYYRKSYEKPK